MPTNGHKAQSMRNIINNSCQITKFITLFRSITMFYGTDNIVGNIPHMHSEYEEHYREYYQSHGTLLWIWIIWCCNLLIINSWLYTWKPTKDGHRRSSDWGECFWHNRLRSWCLQVQPSTCWHPPGFPLLNWGIFYKFF